MSSPRRPKDHSAKRLLDEGSADAQNGESGDCGDGCKPLTKKQIKKTLKKQKFSSVRKGLNIKFRLQTVAIWEKFVK